jgi:16S rRNA (uracil1498-N3)-methyltransferase
MGGRNFSESMTAERFYYSELDSETSQVILDVEESHHLIRVTRKRKGDTIELLNGAGLIAHACVADFNRNRAVLDILRITKYSKMPFELHLAVGFPKTSSVFETILRCCSELGVTRFWPLIAHRSNEQSVTEVQKRMSRWRKIIVSACKQARQPWFPAIEQPRELDLFCHQIPVNSILKFVGSEPGIIDAKPSRLFPERNNRNICWTVGPEGGWTSDEIKLIQQSDFIPVQLGNLVLTVPSACMAGIAAIRMHYQLF